MNALRLPFLLSMLCLTSVVVMADDKPKDKPAVRLEFRRAEEKPMDGLIEATDPNGNEKIYMHKTAELTNEDIAKVEAGASRRGDLEIRFTFTKESARKMMKFSTEQVNKPIAILVDGKVICAPRIAAPILSEAAISGNFTKEQIDKIVSGFKNK